jgi:hypothetical protein
LDWSVAPMSRRMFPPLCWPATHGGPSLCPHRLGPFILLNNGEPSLPIAVMGPAWQGELGMDAQHDFWVMTASTLAMLAVCSIAFAVVVQLH